MDVEDSELTELFVEAGLLSIAYKTIGYVSILNYLDNKPFSPIRDAAFSWIVMDKNVPEREIISFITNNISYNDTFIYFPRLTQERCTKLYSKLNKYMYAYCVKDNQIHLETKDDEEILLHILKSKIEYLRLTHITYSITTLELLLSKLDRIQLKNEKFKTIVYNHVLIWLTPLYSCIPKLDIDLDILTRLLTHIDYNDTLIKIKIYGSVFRVYGKTDIYIAYLLGYPIQSMVELKDGERDKLIQQLKEVKKNRSIIAKRIHDIAILSVKCDSKKINPDDELSQNLNDSLSTSTMLNYDNMVFNKTDSIMFDEITSYSPFDIIRYKASNGTFYQLTRNEYPFIASKMKDPWTLEPVDKDILDEFADRDMIAIKNNLPECQPLLMQLNVIFPREKLMK